MTVTYLLVTAEGQAELEFTKKVLSKYLAEYGIYPDSRAVLTSKDNRSSKEYRGGITNYAKARRDIVNWLKERSTGDCIFTTMFDYYALPNDFPGYNEAQSFPSPYEKVAFIEDALSRDIGDKRFIPYIQLHELEALIFSDLNTLNYEYDDCKRGVLVLEQMLEQTLEQNPEYVNQGRETAPSKRIIANIPSYDKVDAAVSIIECIGIEKIRSRCRHFSEWIRRILEHNQ